MRSLKKRLVGGRRGRMVFCSLRKFLKYLGSWFLGRKFMIGRLVVRNMVIRNVLLRKLGVF